MLDNHSIDAALFDPITYTYEQKFDDIFGRLRREQPVYWAQPNGCSPFWAISKYADVVEIARQNRTFLNGEAATILSAAEAQAIHSVPGFFPFNRTILMMDEPEHRAYRDIAQAWFTPGAVSALRATIKTFAEEAVCRMTEFGGECDFVNDIAGAFPLRVIMNILGIPTEDEIFLLNLTRRIFAPMDSDFHGDQGASAVNMADYFADLLSNKRRSYTRKLVTA